MRVAVTGAHGQLGRSLTRTAPPEIELHAWTREELDICNDGLVNESLHTLRPDVVINAAAYTAVDQAESDTQAAKAVNVDAVDFLAKHIRQIGGRLIHISTDFVFSGDKSTPYLPNDETAPINIYGKTKLEGEKRALLHLDDRVVVLRSAWLYSSFGSNFVTTILNAARSRKSLRVVSDQVGSPTWTVTLARAIWRMVFLPEIHGTFHWADEGQVSRYDFALAIVEESARTGLIDEKVEIQPVQSIDYPMPAQRPPYSVLETSDTVKAIELPPQPWRSNLRLLMEEMAGA